MAKIKYKRLCRKCKKFFLPDKTKLSRFGYCKNCRTIPGKCKVITKIGYQCQNKPEFFGYCLQHFLTEPIKNIVKEAKKL